MILGSTGMAGHVVYHILEQSGAYHLINVAFKTKLNEQTIICDVTNKQSLEDLIAKEQPDIIVNCVGILIKGSKDNPDNSIYINAYLPHFLSRLTKEYGAKVIHLSTDCVFSGAKGNYTETDFRDADDVYGKGKALGELNNENDLTIRTSIIGPELKAVGEGLFSWLMQQNGRISGYTKAFWSGLTTLELAKFIVFSIENNLTGLVHATNNDKISKHDLLELIIKHYKLNQVNLEKEESKAIDKSLLNTRKDFKYAFPSYDEMLKEQYELKLNP